QPAKSSASNCGRSLRSGRPTPARKTRRSPERLQLTVNLSVHTRPWSGQADNAAHEKDDRDTFQREQVKTDIGALADNRRKRRAYHGGLRSPLFQVMRAASSSRVCKPQPYLTNVLVILSTLQLQNCKEAGRKRKGTVRVVTAILIAGATFWGA